MKKLNSIDWLAFILVLIGGLNWGLVGFLNFNLVTAIFGDASTLSRLIFAIVGLATLYLATQIMKFNKSN